MMLKMSAWMSMLASEQRVLHGARLAELQDLALDKVGDDARDELDDLRLAKARERRGCAPEQKVTAKDRVLVAERGGRGRRTAAPVCVVDNIVVQQGRDMDHLHDLGEARLRRE
jgi:hypothetical protein